MLYTPVYCWSKLLHLKQTLHRHLFTLVTGRCGSLRMLLLLSRLPRNKNRIWSLFIDSFDTPFYPMWHTYSVCGTRPSPIDAPRRVEPSWWSSLWDMNPQPSCHQIWFSQCCTQRPQLRSLVLASLMLCGKRCDLSWSVSQRCWYTEWDECSSQRLALIWAPLLSDFRGQYTSACVWDRAWALTLNKSTHTYTFLSLLPISEHTQALISLWEKNKNPTQNPTHRFPYP